MYDKSPAHFFRIGNKVYAGYGSPELTVVDFNSDTVTCSWLHPDGSVHEGDWPSAVIRWIPDDGRGEVKQIGEPLDEDEE